MKRAKRILAVILAMLLSLFVNLNVVSASGVESTSIVNLEVDGEDNPLGIDNATPYFSWQMQSNELGQHQQDYQIIVAKDLELSDIVWDSGIQPDSTSIGIRYEGQTFDSSTRYYWKVFVTDQNGVRIESEIAQFETALMGTTAKNRAGSDFIEVGSSTDESLTDGFHYTVEGDIKIDMGAGDFVFNHIDSGNFLFWQINTGAEQSARCYFVPPDGVTAVERPS